MSIIIKLIGHIIVENDNKYIYEYKLNNITILSFDVIKTTFCSYGLNEDDFDTITVTCDCKNLKNESIIVNEDKKVYLFTCNLKIRNELKDIFITHGHKILLPDTNSQLFNQSNQSDQSDQLDQLDKSDQSDQLDQLDKSDQSDEVDDQSDEVDFTAINKEATELFKDTDFIFLLKTYIYKPNLFKVFYKYISSGNIIINKKSTENTNIEYLNSLQTIKNLGLGFTDDQINEALSKTNNHINLSMRYLLFKKVEENI